MRKVAIFVMVAFISSPLIPSLSGANTFEIESDQRFERDYPSDYIELESGLEINEYICGYSLDRQTRGDCDSSSAAGELWFKYSIPNNQVGDVFKFEIVNERDPHYVDLSVNVCKGNTYYSNHLVCSPKDDMYSNTEQEFYVSPVITSHYYLHLIAWDEEKEDRKAGGDLTEVEVKITRIASSNYAESEPVDITPTIVVGEVLFDTVCAIGCDDGEEDPFDIYKFSGIKGDFIQFEFGSNEEMSTLTFVLK